MNREEPEKTFFLRHPTQNQPYHQSSKRQTPGQANKTNDEDIGNKLVQINYQTLDNGLFGTSWLADWSSPFASNSYPKTESMLTGTSDKNNEDKLLKGVQSYSFIHSLSQSKSCHCLMLNHPSKSPVQPQPRKHYAGRIRITLTLTGQTTITAILRNTDESIYGFGDAILLPKNVPV